MGFASGSSSVSLDDIMSRVSELDILAFYLNISEVPCIINSPLRVDKRPSFGLYSLDGNRIFYKDLSKGDSGGIFDLLSQLWNTDYKQTLERVYQDSKKFSTNHAIGRINSFKGRKNSRTYTKDTDLQVKVRDWKKHDIDYWESFGVSLPWLKFGGIYPISHIIVTKDGNRYTIPAEKYAYVYVEKKDDIVSLKIYQPYSKTHKWSNKSDSSVWQLWRQLPNEGDKLIITSSRKDALCIWENTGIPSCALQAESALPKEHVMQQLKDRFKHIYVLYDNDFQSIENHGRKLGATLASYFGLTQLEIPDIYMSKDTSDLSKNHGREVVKKVILSLINEEKQELINPF